MEQKTATGDRAWIARAEGTQVRVREGGGSVAVLTGVTGTLYENGAEASKFRSPNAEAVQSEHTLTLLGGVTVIALERGLTLKADRVTYREDLQLIEASGTVTVTSDVYVLGPFETLVTTPDLRKVGTPDTFGK